MRGIYMQSQLIKSIASLLATVLAATLLVVGAPSASNAEGVADYLTKCSYPDDDRDVTLSKGDSLRACPNAVIKIYHNGSLIDRYETTAAGVRARNLLSNRQTAECLIAVVGAIGSANALGGVRTLTGSYMKIGGASLAAWGLNSCKAP